MFDADEQQDPTLRGTGAAQPAPCFKYFPFIYPQESILSRNVLGGEKRQIFWVKYLLQYFCSAARLKIKEISFITVYPPPL